MARTGSTAKTTTINRLNTFVSAGLDVSSYCRDLENWPRSWMGWERDLPAGERLVACFRPFLQHVVSSGPFPQDHSPTCGQPLAARRRDHPGPKPNPFSEKGWRRAFTQRSDP